MAIVEFTLEGRGYVILPMREYKRLLTLAENAHDVRKATAMWSLWTLGNARRSSPGRRGNKDRRHQPRHEIRRAYGFLCLPL